MNWWVRDKVDRECRMLWSLEGNRRRGCWALGGRDGQVRLGKYSGAGRSQDVDGLVGQG